MSKTLLILIVFCILALGVYIYFIFGFNQRSSDRLVPPTEPTPTTALDANQQLKIEDITVGTGPEVKNGDTVVIHYSGTLTNGTKFDSSYDRNEPYETPIGVGAVIKGWDLGVIGMKAGGKRKLTIPASLGYGERGSGVIPPNSTLIFELELVSIK